MNKKIIILLVITALILGSLIYYLSFILPDQLKDLIVKKTADYLKRPLSVQKIHYHFFGGVVIQGLVVYETDAARTPFFTVEEAKFNVFLPALLKEKTIVIPGILLRKPFVRLARDQNGRWNFSDLCPRDTSPKSSLPFIIGGLAAQDGRIQISDQLIHQDLQVTGVAVKTRLTAIKGVTCELEAHLPDQASILKARGRYHPFGKELILEAALSHLDVEKFLPYCPLPPDVMIKKCQIAGAEFSLTLKNQEIEALEGNFNLTADLSLGDQHIQGQCTSKELNFSKRGQRQNFKTDFLRIKNASLSWGGKFYQGDFQAKDLAYSRNEKYLNLKGSFRLQDSVLNLEKYQIRGKDILLYQLSAALKDGMLKASGSLSGKDALIETGGKTAIQGSMAQVNAMPFSLTWQNGNLDYRSPLDIKNFRITAGPEVSLSGSLAGKDLQLSITGKKILLRSLVQTQDFILALDQGRSFAGNPLISIKGVYDPSESKPWNYSGFMILTNARLKGVPSGTPGGTPRGTPQFGEISALSGKLEFQTDEVKTSGLSMTAFQTPMRFTGKVKNFQDPYFEGTMDSDSVNLQILKILDASFLKTYDLVPSGQAEAHLKYAGRLSSFQRDNLDLTAALKGVTLESPRFLPFSSGKISNLFGIIRLNGDTLTWQDLKGTVDGTEYATKGSLKNFSHPWVQADLTTPTGKFSVQMTSDGNTYKINSLTGQTASSSFDIAGDLRMNPGSSAYLDFKGNLEMDFADLRALSPKIRKVINPMNLVGKIRSEAAFRGHTDSWDKGVIHVRAESPQIMLCGYRLNDVALQWEQGTKSLGSLNITADIYSGKLNISSLFDTKKPGLPFELSAKLEGTRLELLKQDTQLKKQALQGTLDSNFSIQGDLKDADSITGNGMAAVKDGYIWRLNFLEGIGRVLFIPELEDTVFTDAQAHFNIRDRRITTGDLFLAGKFADLHGRGWVDFNHKIDMDITPKFKQTEIARSTSLRKGPSAILAQTEGYINIKITGTLEHPSYSVKTSPGKVLQKATNSILDGVQGIIEEIIP